MIPLTRFHSGERIAVNPDLIERIEETPDTVITLTNGTKYVVGETVEEISEMIQLYRATVLAFAHRLTEDPEVGRVVRLRVVPDETPDHGGGGHQPEVGGR